MAAYLVDVVVETPMSFIESIQAEAITGASFAAYYPAS